MTYEIPPAGSLRDVFSLLRAYPLRWLIPALAVAIAATVYAERRPITWEASQALMVRDEAAGTDHPGRFRVLDDMKTVQDTIMELVKSHSVLQGALREIGPVAGRSADGWPSERDVATLEPAVKLSPPHGAEFGKTAVFYLQVQDADRDRAIALAAALSAQLQGRFEDLRDATSQSVIDESSKAVAVSQAALTDATRRLAEMDAAAGADLGELRILMDAPSGDSPLRRSITEMAAELRGAQTSLETNQESLALLREAQSDPGRLAAGPGKLLESQPALKRLIDGLVDAQLHRALLAGTMSDDHPQMAAARQAEAEITAHLREELGGAIRGVESDVRVAEDRVEVLQQQLVDARQRLDRLAKIRADYANLVAEVHRRDETLKGAESQLAEARASQAAAHTASLLSRIDAPQAGLFPLGPSRAAIIAAGCGGGLLAGLGVLLLTVPIVVGGHRVAEGATSTAEAAMLGAATTEALAGSAGSLSFKQALSKIDQSKRVAR